jgi:hypothetical protein
MPNLDFLKPLAARAPKILHEVGKIIDAHGDGDGVVEISDAIDVIKEVASNVIEKATDLLD